MCGRFLSTDSVQLFSNSINEDYRQLSTRSLIYGENLSYQKWLFQERMCGTQAHRLAKNYVAITDVHGDMDLISTLRIMQSCILHHYTGFAFQKHSPYTKLFNFHIRR